MQVRVWDAWSVPAPQKKGRKPLPGPFPDEMVLPGVHEKHTDLHKITTHLMKDMFILFGQKKGKNCVRTCVQVCLQLGDTCDFPAGLRNTHTHTIYSALPAYTPGTGLQVLDRHHLF